MAIANYMRTLILSALFLFYLSDMPGQIYLGSDLSYVNELEDCGTKYTENFAEKDVYQIFFDHGCNLARYRLWHTPTWYDNLNSGNRYSDHNDVTKAIKRAKATGMDVLLDFHLSDNWADPGKQLVPAAWASVVGDIDILKDSLYNYIYQTLTLLLSEDAVPDMIQVGNETNKGILLSEEDNSGGWVLEWERNAALFNIAIKAIRDFQNINGEDIDVMIHAAGPADTEWLIDAFVENGVIDFDVIGISYYWAWHKPTSIEETGAVVNRLKNKYPEKKVIIVETGYLWTTDSNDNANNIINETHPDYSPASPENQRDWLVDLTQEVINNDGDGVVYWEPAWVSSNCWTQWGQGSHQEHATFFDFDNNLLIPGGIEFFSHNYQNTNSSKDINIDHKPKLIVQFLGSGNDIKVKFNNFQDIIFKNASISLTDVNGQVLNTVELEEHFNTEKEFFLTSDTLKTGLYFVSFKNHNEVILTEKIIVSY